MKLMKKNSRDDKYKTIPSPPTYKFNWDKITERKSDTKSILLDSNQKISNLDEIIEMKLKIKELTNSHTKCH